jgi:hypothetical protein
MITAVSVSTVTTVASMVSLGLTSIFSMGAGALLLVLLVTKQLALASGGGFALRLGRFATVGIAPFLIGFGIIVAFKLFQIMS